MTLNGANYDNPAKCDAVEYGLQSVDLEGTAAREAWRTDKGLRIGDSQARMLELYAQAHRGTAAGFWDLVADPAEPSITLLSAYVKAGQITDLFVFVGVTD